MYSNKSELAGTFTTLFKTPRTKPFWARLFTKDPYSLAVWTQRRKTGGIVWMALLHRILTPIGELCLYSDITPTLVTKSNSVPTGRTYATASATMVIGMLGSPCRCRDQDGLKTCHASHEFPLDLVLIANFAPWFLNTY